MNTKELITRAWLRVSRERTALGSHPESARAALEIVAAERAIELGPLVEAFNPRIQGIVDGWAEAVSGSRAIALGLPRPPTLEEIVRQYLEDYGG